MVWQSVGEDSGRGFSSVPNGWYCGSVLRCHVRYCIVVCIGVTMMDNVCDTVHSLRAQIAAIEDVLQGLYEQLKRAEQHGMAFLVGQASPLFLSLNAL